MIRTTICSFFLIGVVSSCTVAAPTLTMVPLGLQSGNWVWRVDIGPDLVIGAPDTPMALELGFRLTGSPLLSVSNVNPGVFNPANPGKAIFGWETPDPSANNHPVGLQFNLATSEVFSAFGTPDLATPGPFPFLQFVARGPNNGGGSTSTIEWLGAYPNPGVGGKGRIAQISGGTPPNFQVTNFDIYAGSATQIPEPATVVLMAICGVAAVATGRNR